jgi:hypothetical protein
MLSKGVSPRSVVEWILLDPVKPATDKQELVEVNELELHMNPVAVHVAIHGHLILRHVLAIKVGFPVLVILLAECERISVDLCVESRVGIVHALKRHPVGQVKDSPAPTIIVVEQRRADLTIDRKLVHIPDAVERRFRASAAEGVPAIPTAIGINSYQPDAQDDLDGQHKAVRTACAEQLRFVGGSYWAIPEEEVSKATELRRQQEHRHQEQMEGEEFYRNVVRHIEH